MRKKNHQLRKALAALVLGVAVLAQPLTASAWLLDAEQQQVVNNLTSGREALLQGNYQQAVSDLSRVIQLSGSNIGAYYYRARAYQYMGRSSDAAADYSRVAMMTRSKNGYYSSYYGDAQSLAIQLGASSIGTTVLSGAIADATASAQVTDADGTQRQVTAEEAALAQQLMASQTQPALTESYQLQFGDPVDNAGVQEVVSKRTAALTGPEETYTIGEKETLYCGSGRTGLCFNGADTIELVEKTKTTDEMAEEILDRLNPLSPIVTIFQGEKEEVKDYAPRYVKLSYSLSNPYTSIVTENGKTKISVPTGTQVKVLYSVSEGVSVGVDYYTFTVDPGEKMQDSSLQSSVYFVGV